MLFKSYLLENNIKKIFSHNFFLFYGDNEGLKKEFKEKLRSYTKQKILTYFQEEILNNDETFINELHNKSLFDDQKIYIIDEADDKILKIIEEYENLDNIKVFVFSKFLAKKSKLRIFFEKSKLSGVTACYEDNEITLRKIISEKLKDINGITPSIINYIINNSGLDRNKINNEINKIKFCFKKDKIEIDKLDQLLNINENYDFNHLRDAAINGNIKRTNNLMSDTVLDEFQSSYYLNSINLRLQKIKDIIDQKEEKNESTEQIINDLSPPVFWKDKPNLIHQTNKLNKKKVFNLLQKCNRLELIIKTNSVINKSVLIKNLIVDIAKVSNS